MQKRKANQLQTVSVHRPCSPGKPVAEVGPVGSLHPCLVQGPQQPAANQHQPWTCQHCPPFAASFCFRKGDPFTLSVRLKGTIACVVLPGTSKYVHTSLFNMEVMLRFTVISHKVTPTGFLTQSQAQSVNKEVPGLMFFLHKAAGSQAQDMAHCAQKKEEIHF